MKRFLNLCDRILVRYTPDPFVIAILLTWVALVMALVITDSTPREVATAWGNGFWQLAEFTLQMVMTLLGGYVVATSPPARYLFDQIVSRVRSPLQGVLVCTFASMAGAWVSWGLGLVVGGLVARETGRRLPDAPFRIFVAASYSGFLVWHGGLSGSIPLAVNTEGNFSLEWLGGQTMPLSQTTFGATNLVVLALLVVTVPLVNVLLLRWAEKNPQTGAAGHRQPAVAPGGASGPAAGHSQTPAPVSADDVPLYLERTAWMSVALAIPGLAWVMFLFADGQLTLNLNTLNLALFMTGLLLHASPLRFSSAVSEGGARVAPILIQYPLYAALMGVLLETGLATQMTEWFVSISSKEMFPLMTFFSAGLVNLFVPSGGGQWAVQGPVVLPAAQALGSDIPKTVMAVAWGDAWTNMAQPFWAVPLLAIAGLRIRDIIGPCLVVLLASGAAISIAFLVT